MSSTTRRSGTDKGLRIAVIGSRGIPARYGGFETFAQELAPRLVRLGHDVTVYCRSGYTGSQPEYRGVRLVHTPYLRARPLETLSHELTSILDSLRRGFDVYYFLGTRSSILYWPLRVAGRRIVVHTDGIEWKRRKWGPAGRAWLRFSEWFAARVVAGQLVTDARAMRDHYLERYGVPSACIPYGAPLLEGEPDLGRFGLEPGGYHLVVCRLEPENNVDEIIAAFIASGSGLGLVVVGDAETATGRELVDQAAGANVRFIGPVYGDDLAALRLGADSYVHGHEVGGLNPSLLEAMGAGNACLALDTPFNREALAGTGRFWRDAASLASLIDWVEQERGASGELGSAARERAAVNYDWDEVAAEHDRLFRSL